MSQAQTTVTFQPNGTTGEDMVISTTYGCTKAGAAAPNEYVPDTVNETEMRYSDWTYNGEGCPHGTSRALIRFTEMNTLPADAVVTNATLTLTTPATSMHYANSSFPGSGYSTTNEGWARRVTSDWSEDTTTWSGAPAATATNEVAIPVTTSHFDWSTTLNVTQMVQDIIASGTNYGFMLLLQNEATYRCALFATSDNADSTIRPALSITYTSASGVGQTASSVPLTIFPNPATDAVQIYLPYSITGHVTIQICDLTGQIVAVREITANGQSINLSVKDLSSGLYIVRASGSNWNALGKISVQ